MRSSHRAIPTGGKSRVLVVDDHPIFREGLVMVINSVPGFSVCGEATAAPEALTFLREKKCDIVLIDISLPGTDGIELTKLVHAEYAELPIVVVSLHDEPEYRRRAISAGAIDYVSKGAGVAPLLAVLRKLRTAKH